jgi:hypothetical protein
VLGLVTLLLFWGAGDHTQAVGRRMAMDVEQHVDGWFQARPRRCLCLCIGVSPQQDAGPLP